VRILIIDDDLGSEEVRDLFKLRLSMTPLAAIRDIDEKTRRELVDTELAKDGLELEFAFDGDAALTHYRERSPYDLVLTDLYHPGMNGLIWHVLFDWKTQRKL
jgi:CheY-like chemotaxis protein